MVSKKLMAFIFAGTLLTATGVSTAGASSNVVVPSKENLVGQATETFEPNAVPAIVVTAFVTGAATAAGAKVGDWVADKVTGIWSADSTIDGNTDLDVIFD